MPQLIEHVGILVTDLEDAIEKWTAATGYTFSPIVRYRTAHYIDSSEPTPHFHDARISLSREGSPRIELMEATGKGTHAPSELGVHHFGFNGIEDPETMEAQMNESGLPTNGKALTDDGRTLLWFTDKRVLDGVRLEFVSTLPGPLVADDGSALPPNPLTGRPDIWADRNGSDT